MTQDTIRLPKPTTPAMGANKSVVFPKQLVWIKAGLFAWLLIQLAIPFTLKAQSIDSRWINISGGTFDNHSNWEGGVPSPDMNANFDINSFYDVELESERTIRAFQQSDGEIIWFGGTKLTLTNDSSLNAGILTLRGAGTTFNALGEFRIGDTGVAEMNIESNTQLSTHSAIVGGQAGATGSVFLAGQGAQWTNESDLIVGDFGTGNVEIGERGQVISSNRSTIIGNEAGSVGMINLNGQGAQWNTKNLKIGLNGQGTVNLDRGAISSKRSDPRFFSSTIIGESVGATGVLNIRSSQSFGNVEGLWVGSEGSGQLSLIDGGHLRSIGGNIGVGEDSVGIVSVEGTGSHWDARVAGGASASVLVGGDGRAQLNVSNGGRVSADDHISIGERSTLSVSGANSIVEATEILNRGKAAVVDGAQLVTSSFSSVYRSGEALISGPESSWSTTEFFLHTDGHLQISNGGYLSGAGSIGSSGVGIAEVIGADSFWDMGSTVAKIGSNLDGGDGKLLIREGGRVESRSGLIANAQASTGNVEVSGLGSSWLTSQSLEVGSFGLGEMQINNGGYIRNFSSTMGATDNGTAHIVVNGSNSLWELESSLSIGSFGASTLEIQNGGIVRVGLGAFGGQTTIGSQGSVVLTGGRFEFGATDLESLGRISGTNGSLIGAIEFEGYNHVSTLSVPSIQNLDVSEIHASNSGVIYGDGATRIGLKNNLSGEVRTTSGRWTRFGGAGNSNSGEINNFGGIVEFENDLTNQSDGFIGGRGQFIYGDGLTNAGVIAHSVGQSDILGDVSNIGNGQIVTSGFASTTFFDDVVHNGAEIRTAEGSATIFLGQYSGEGSFTGTGDVFFEGDLRPGNSPNVIDFESDVFLGSGANTFVELAGLEYGEFDKFNIAGDLFVDGTLSIDLLGGFLLGNNQEFLFAEVGGVLAGQFDGLAEGGLIGTYGGRDLFISYSRGDGNDIGLFTSVPEPSSGLILMLAGLGLCGRRRHVFALRV